MPNLFLVAITLAALAYSFYQHVQIRALQHKLPIRGLIRHFVVEHKWMYRPMVVIFGISWSTYPTVPRYFANDMHLSCLFGWFGCFRYEEYVPNKHYELSAGC